VVKIKGENPPRPQQFQAILRIAEGSKRLIPSIGAPAPNWTRFR